MKRRIKLFSISIFCIVLNIMSANTVFSQGSEIAEIQAAIQAKGANWTAGESWVTKLNSEERRALLGENTDVLSPVEPETLSFDTDAPSAIDWRNKDGHNWITPIRDQQSCGSCVAFGSVATLESLIRIEKNLPNQNIDLSEMHLFNCNGGKCSNGWYNSSACYNLKNNGTPDEDCWPYQPVDRQCSNTCSDWESRAVKITSYGAISGIQAHMNYVAIAPVLVSYEVYTDFYSYSGGIYEQTWGDYEGGHAVSIVGYDTTGQVPYWIVKNSWGASWGESGYFRIKMGECNIENRSSYWMSGAILPATPDFSIDIKANGSDGPVTISQSQPLALAINLNAGGHTDNADWWVLGNTPMGWYRYAVPGGWGPGISVTYQGPLFDLPSFTALNATGLPLGDYTFYFGVDTEMNGSIDLGQMNYDSVNVSIANAGSAVGTWSMNYDWSCDGNDGNTTWYIHSDGTFTTSSSYSGTWTQVGDQVTLVYTSGTTYTGTINPAADYMSGTMISHLSATGCWTANRTTQDKQALPEKGSPDSAGN